MWAVLAINNNKKKLLLDRLNLLRHMHWKSDTHTCTCEGEPSGPAAVLHRTTIPSTDMKCLNPKIQPWSTYQTRPSQNTLNSTIDFRSFYFQTLCCWCRTCLKGLKKSIQEQMFSTSQIAQMLMSCSAVQKKEKKIPQKFKGTYKKIQTFSFFLRKITAENIHKTQRA